MAEFDNTNTFTLFKNDKEEGSKQPDYRGKMDIDGVEKEIAAWIRVSAKGTKFMSGKISEPYKKNEGAPKKSATGGLAEMSDDIPF